MLEFFLYPLAAILVASGIAGVAVAAFRYPREYDKALKLVSKMLWRVFLVFSLLALGFAQGYRAAVTGAQAEPFFASLPWRSGL